MSLCSFKSIQETHALSSAILNRPQFKEGNKGVLLVFGLSFYQLKTKTNSLQLKEEKKGVLVFGL